jgi:hypothetical protein
VPQQKDLKRLVRARMQKTGEAYTAARAHILTKATPNTAPKRPAKTTALPAIDYAALAGLTSDAALKEKTGCGWERWVKTLDQFGAGAMTHRDIARLVHEKFKVPGWWAQTVTVGYERITGRRAIGQRGDGSYEASKSRTFNVPVDELFAAWADARARRRWLDETGVKVRTSTKPKTIRLAWSDGAIVNAWFTPKGAARSTVAIAHTKLPDRASSERQKQYWSERLTALQQVLSGEAR